MVKIATGEAVAAVLDDDGVYGYESIFIVSATLHTYPWQTHIWHQRARKLISRLYNWLLLAVLLIAGMS